ncbi:MAG TPA: DUF3341 domain-containing protein [Rhizomicrobium sp.]|jgi:hypothetical protein|nr:DUF3341 domain-containing protein [Rhizomicrobium sp.]
MILLASFPSPDALAEAMKTMHARGIAIHDAYTPFPVKALDALLPETDRGERAIMLACGFGVAVVAYFIEWWTAVVAYPFDSGSRPHHSWPVFVLFPFELGILAAAVAGLIAFFIKTGLPRYHDAIFECDLIARSNVDAFVLAIEAPEDRTARADLFTWFVSNGADAVRELNA